MFILMLLLLLNTGCAGTIVSMPQDELARLSSQPAIHVMHYVPEPFEVLRESDMLRLQGGLLFNAFSGQSPQSLAQTMVKDYSLEDPAIRVTDNIIAALHARLKLQNLRVVSQMVDDRSFNELSQTLESGRALTLKSTKWSVIYFAFDTSHYRIAYQGHARLLDIRSFQTKWEATCRYLGDPRPRPSLDELQEDGARLLKAELDKAADVCSQQLLAQLFGP